MILIDDLQHGVVNLEVHKLENKCEKIDIYGMVSTLNVRHCEFLEG